MNNINNIVTDINKSFKTHNIKDIKFFGVCDLVEKNEKTTPCELNGSEYTPVLNDTSGIVVYHRILDFDNDEDLEEGYGRNSLTTENYSMLSVFYGNLKVIEQGCLDNNQLLATEFKKLLPRNVSITDIHRINCTGLELNKTDLTTQEGIELIPENIIFGINYNVVIKTTENCNTLSCG